MMDRKEFEQKFVGRVYAEIPPAEMDERWDGFYPVVSAGHVIAIFDCAAPEDDPYRGYPIVGGDYIDGDATEERRYGAKECAAALGYPANRKGRSKFGVYRNRGLLPAPAFIIAASPVWTHAQVQAFKAQRAPVSTGGRPIDSAYDRDFAAATGTLIEDLRKAGHEVGTPVTGSVIVDGIEILAESWDGVAAAYGQENIDAAWDYIREKFGAKE